MDPFLGLGSTAVACAQLGLNFIGVEMDEEYLGVAIDRASLAAGKQKLPTPKSQLPKNSQPID